MAHFDHRAWESARMSGPSRRAAVVMGRPDCIAVAIVAMGGQEVKPLATCLSGYGPARQLGCATPGPAARPVPANAAWLGVQ